MTIAAFGTVAAILLLAVPSTGLAGATAPDGPVAGDAPRSETQQDGLVAVLGFGLAAAAAVATLGLLFARRRGRRVAISVTASHAADPERVRDVLRRVADDCPLLVQDPPPAISFDDIGANGFVFSLDAAAPDAASAAKATTDLRLAIVRAFRAAGIEIAHPQHDIHLRDLDRLWALLSRVAAERAAEAARETPKAPGSGKEPPASDHS